MPSSPMSRFTRNLPLVMVTILHMISDMTADLGPILEDVGDRIVSANSSGEVLQEMIKRRPDIIILPDGTEPVEGVELLPVIRRMTDRPIVFVGGGDADRQAQTLLQGADAYLTLPLRRITVKSRLMSLLRPRSLRITNKILPSDIRHPNPPSIRTFGLQLSPTESRLLCALMNGRGRLIPADELAAEVWGEYNKLDSLRFYVSQLRFKLSEHSTLRILNQKGIGYRIEFQPQHA